MKLLREYIRQILKEEGELGRFVWPSASKGPPEPDTEVELMLYQQLHNHFGAIAPLSDSAISAIQQILDSGQYTKVFQPCKSGPVLRGMRLPVSWLLQYAPEALATLSDSPTDPIDWAPPIQIKPFMYKSEGKYGNVSSWTGDWEAARLFTTQWSSDTIPVILHSECSSGYFMYTDSFARYKGGRYRDEFGIRKLNPQGKSEKEILLFGSSQVTAIQINATSQQVDRLKK